MAIHVRERLLRKAKRQGECLIWEGAASADGYGKIKVAGKVVYVHRVSYSEFVGDIPEGLQIDHICRQTLCIEPKHLEPVTGKENRQRGTLSYRSRTKCKNGHDITLDDNVIFKKDGTKKCRKCQYKRTAEWVKKDRQSRRV